MENATEALKMAFAVLVFVIAMTATFMLVTGARSTADVIFTSKDDQEYVNGITSIGQQKDVSGNLIQYREVGIDTIVPTIYRYAQENYGVIIIDGEEIVGIYDLVVENTVSKYYSTWNKNDNENELTKLCIGTSDKEGIAQYIKNATGISIDNIDKYEELFGNIYEIQTPDSVSCPWTASTYNIMQRIKVDMHGVKLQPLIELHEFGNGTLKYSGAFFSSIEPDKNGFIKRYKNDTFKEYFYNVKTTNNLTEEKETDRIQIIYVK